MPRITLQAVAAYLESLYAEPARVLSMTTEGKQEAADDLKAFGYGLPLFLEYEVPGLQSSYEPPLSPKVTVDGQVSPKVSADLIFNKLTQLHYI